MLIHINTKLTQRGNHKYRNKNNNGNINSNYTDCYNLLGGATSRYTNVALRREFEYTYMSKID